MGVRIYAISPLTGFIMKGPFLLNVYIIFAMLLTAITLISIVRVGADRVRTHDQYQQL